MNLILASIGVFLGITLLLVVILLVAKQYLTPSGKVKITINGEKELEVEQGSTLLNTLSVNGIYLSSACGGKGSCGPIQKWKNRIWNLYECGNQCFYFFEHCRTIGRDY